MLPRAARISTGTFAAAAALLALTGCNAPAGDDNVSAPQTASAPEQEQEPSADPAPAAQAAEAAPPAEAAAPQPPTVRPASGAVTARRCGWLHNPTPGNWWLFDGRGEWILGSQGGHQSEGLDEIPDMTPFGWVETNVHYGYGCACMKVTASPGTVMVQRISAIQPLPLQRCQADKALPRP